MTGIRDVSREVGLSTATVSRALRGLPGVSEDTRAKVRTAAAQLGYVPSAAASVLASGQTRTVAVVVPYVTRWFFGQVVTGAESVLRERGYDVLLYNLQGDRAARHRVLSTHLLTKRADGILVLGLEPTETEAEWLVAHAPAMAFVGVPVPGFPSVRIDDQAAARTATQHLLDLGHRRIAYVGGSDEEPLDFAVPHNRLAGHRAALEAAGAELDPSLETMGHFTLPGGLTAGLSLLGRADRPTAVMCASDEMAMGVLLAARKMGVRVPAELSVIGIDDHELSRYVDLTTIAQPVLDMGLIAAERLVDTLLARRNSAGAATQPSEPGDEDMVVPTELIVRGSTAAPPS